MKNPWESWNDCEYEKDMNLLGGGECGGKAEWNIQEETGSGTGWEPASADDELDQYVLCSSGPQ